MATTLRSGTWWGRAMYRAIVAFSVRSRTRKAALITAYMRAHGIRSVILVGVGGHGGTLSANERIVENALAAEAQVLAACDLLVAPVPWPFVLADGRRLAFRDRAADLVVSSAVLEHVGDELDQRAFIAEQLRVGRHVVLTTPNRWFPVESHTHVVFRHWRAAWRRDRDEFTRLLSLRELRALLPTGSRIVGRSISATFVAFVGPAPALVSARTGPTRGR